MVFDAVACVERTPKSFANAPLRLLDFPSHHCPAVTAGEQRGYPPPLGRTVRVRADSRATVTKRNHPGSAGLSGRLGFWGYMVTMPVQTIELMMSLSHIAR